MMPLALANIGEENMILKVGGEPCTCGNHGCVERYCSATAIIRMAKEAVAQHPIVKVKESRVAISEEMARKIMI